MSDFILVSGDQAMFNPTFAVAVVSVQPGRLTGSGRSQAGGKPVCVAGDESTVVVPGCSYIAPPHVTPGVGILTIAALGPDQTAKQTRSGSKPVLLKGGTFTAKFQVLSPAIDPGAPPAVSPRPDPVPTYTGTGSFLTTNLTVKGT